ncbi:histidine kinase OS=Streptomyces albaduncus OX=68172 GN=FHS32_001211 PE=4 SV=1 [Streptomyces griseoloalbus]
MKVTLERRRRRRHGPRLRRPHRLPHAQEALTNARKHAPGTEVTVSVAGAPGEDLVVSVRNPAPRRRTPVPGSGQGLIGLTERAILAGGTLEHGPTPDGGFAVRACLPWR